MDLGFEQPCMGICFPCVLFCEFSCLGHGNLGPQACQHTHSEERLHWLIPFQAGRCWGWRTANVEPSPRVCGSPSALHTKLMRWPCWLAQD